MTGFASLTGNSLGAADRRADPDAEVASICLPGKTRWPRSFGFE